MRRELSLNKCQSQGASFALGFRVDLQVDKFSIFDHEVCRLRVPFAALTMCNVVSVLSTILI